MKEGTTIVTPQEVLKQYFGYDTFHPGQEEVIQDILAGQDALAVMPTGAGKSICYQVPAMVLDGITVVVSPLISLMQDQVKALNEAGIHAAYINSSLSETQILKALRLALEGRYKIIYVAPERLQSDSFLNFAVHADISMVTVDEAHCISQWGQDFRPSYLRIVDFIRTLAHRPIISAFTATATQEVAEDIRCILGLRNAKVLVTGFDRPNLYFEVDHEAKKDAFVLDYIQKHSADSGIIYCATRKNVDNLYELLFKNGVNVTRYHAGMDNEERKYNQNEFVYDRIPVMVATNAFGMGIDKSNVRYVIHYNMPQSMENYYQEAGRAGRDGEAASCILLFSPQDVIIDRFLLEQKNYAEIAPEDVDNIQERDRQRLRIMENYCLTTQCLRQYILRYFGDISRGEKPAQAISAKGEAYSTDYVPKNDGKTETAAYTLSEADETEPQKPQQEDETEPQKPQQADETEPQKPQQEDETEPQKPQQADETEPQKPQQADETEPQRPRQEGGTERQQASETEPQRPLKSDDTETARSVGVGSGISGCGNCSNCLRIFEEEDMTFAARWIINCVAEARGRFGVNIITGTLVGANRARLREIGAAGWKSYGKLSDISEGTLKDLIPQMVQSGYLIWTEEQYRVLRIGPDAMKLKDESVRVLMKVRRKEESDRKGQISGTKAGKGKLSAQGSDYLTSLGFRLFERLRALRMEIAREQNLPPYIVFTDRTLIDMSVRLPSDREKMLAVSGVAQAKYNRYGERFLDAIKRFIEEHPGEVVSTFDAEAERREKETAGAAGNAVEATGGAARAARAAGAGIRKSSSRKKTEFFIPASAAEKFEYADLYYATEIKDQMNALHTSDKMKKLTGTQITDYLQEQGLIVITKREDGFYDRYPTQKGKEAGILVIDKVSTAGIPYTLLKYPRGIQEMVVQHYVKNGDDDI